MIGIDIVKIDRIKNITHKDAFVSRVLHEAEIAIYHDFNESWRQDQWLAGRFAAKEAIIKALPFENVFMKDVWIQNEDHKLFCEYQGIKLVVSISHETEMAVAIAMILASDPT